MHALRLLGCFSSPHTDRLSVEAYLGLPCRIQTSAVLGPLLMIPQEGLVLGTRPQVFLRACPKTTVGSWELTSSGQVANIQVNALWELNSPKCHHATGKLHHQKH